MKKGKIVTGTVEEIRFPDKGTVHTEEGTVTVKGVLPGEKIEARVTKKHGQGRAEAALTRVLEKSPIECEPPCADFGRCGGCTFMNLPYEETLKLKASMVKKLLDSACQNASGWGLTGGPDFGGIRPSPEPFEYRNKMEFTFGDEYKDGPLSVGQHRKGGFYDILTVENCRIVDADFRAVLTATRDFYAPYYAEGKISYYHRMRHEGYLRHLLIRKAAKTGEILIDIVTSTQEEHEDLLHAWAQKLLSLPLSGTIRGILHTKNDSPADAVKNEGTEILFGKEEFTEELLGLSFRITPFSFFQTNSRGAEVLYRTVKEYLQGLMVSADGSSGKPVVFDLYTGTGTIAQLVAPAAKKVIGVEIVEEAVEAARENAERNGLTNCEFIAGDVLKKIDEIEERPDVIILDPPRDGIHPKALPKILAYKVPYILYISCKPTSLSRDIAGFASSGYRPLKAVCVDMFPWTSSVETVCLFSRL